MEKQTKIHFNTYGCSFNQLDSDVMSGILNKEGYKIVKEESEADLVVINSCTVKNSSEAKLFNDINRLTKENKKIIVCGCVPQAEKSYINSKLKNVTVLGINELDKIIEAVKNTLNGKIYQNLSDLKITRNDENFRNVKENLRLLSPKLNKTEFVEVIPINEGCLNNCTYCKTKSARGNLFSYSIENIVLSTKRAIAGGAKEIYLTSQDTACYGVDIKTNLAELLKELIKIEGDFKIRIGMGNPVHFKKNIDEVLDVILSTDKIYRFLHIPVQSGSNRILSEMRRNNTVEDYFEIIEKIKKRDELFTIANDIIVAYPTETKKEFDETIQVMKKGGSDVLNFSRFWLRPNTPCEDLYSSKDFIEGTESKNRAKKIKEKFQKIAEEKNSKWIGREVEVLITEIGKSGTNSVIARDIYYKHIVIKNCNLEIGTKTKVKILDTNWCDFYSEIIE